MFDGDSFGTYLTNPQVRINSCSSGLSNDLGNGLSPLVSAMDDMLISPCIAFLLHLTLPNHCPGVLPAVVKSLSQLALNLLDHPH